MSFRSRLRNLYCRNLQRFVVTIRADMLKVKALGQLPRGGGVRGKVTRFSSQSRKRMLELLASIRLPFLNAFFMTLTYPSEYSRDPKVWKRDLDTFLKRLRRRCPGVRGIWRMEFQLRGAPHYHLLVWGVDLHPLLFRQWVKATWFVVVGSGDERHYRAGTQCDRVGSRRGATYYVSKYAAKASELPVDPETGELLEVGRWWGKFGELPTAPALMVEIDLTQAIDLRRLVAKLLQSRGLRYGQHLKQMASSKGFTVFGVGDLSFEGWQSLTDSTAFRMIHAVAGGGVNGC